MTVESITNSINQNLETVNHWLNVNKIEVNTHKSYHVVFSNRKKTFISPIRLSTENIAKKITNNFRQSFLARL